MQEKKRCMPLVLLEWQCAYGVCSKKREVIGVLNAMESTFLCEMTMHLLLVFSQAFSFGGNVSYHLK